MGQVQTTEKRAATRRFGRLGARVASGVVLIALVLLAIWLRGPLLMAVVAAATALGAHEVFGMAWRAGYRPWYAAGLALSLLFALRGYLGSRELLAGEASLAPGSGIEMVVLAGVLVAALARSAVLAEREQGRAGIWADLGITLAGAIYTGGLLGYAPLLAARPDEPSSAGGAAWLLLVLVGTAACDTGAYFAGSFFGRHKMAPHVSPAKTWEGFAGGAAGALLGTLALSPLLKLDTGPALLLGLLVCAAAVSGDLSESLLKRASGVKDSGSIIPGHGGILDRIDSVLFVILAVYWFSRVAA